MLAQRTHCLRFRVTLLSDIEDLVSLIQPFAHELLRAHHIGTAGVDTDQPFLLCLRLAASLIPWAVKMTMPPPFHPAAALGFGAVFYGGDAI